jgi:flagellar operon protein
MSIDPLRFSDLRVGPAAQAPQRPASVQGQPSPAQGPTFAEQLEALRTAEPTKSQGAGPLKFSGHAQTRMQSRQIPWGAPEMERLEGAVERAAGKGARESLVLLDQTALVVSVPNRTVITVVDREQLKQNVFTNIDSAVIA